jgi:hypothetical protein
MLMSRSDIEIPDCFDVSEGSLFCRCLEAIPVPSIARREHCAPASLYRGVEQCLGVISHRPQSLQLPDNSLYRARRERMSVLFPHYGEVGPCFRVDPFGKGLAAQIAFAHDNSPVLEKFSSHLSENIVPPNGSTLSALIYQYSLF